MQCGGKNLSVYIVWVKKLSRGIDIVLVKKLSRGIGARVGWLHSPFVALPLLGLELRPVIQHLSDQHLHLIRHLSSLHTHVLLAGFSASGELDCFSLVPCHLGFSTGQLDSCGKASSNSQRQTRMVGIAVIYKQIRDYLLKCSH